MDKFEKIATSKEKLTADKLEMISSLFGFLSLMCFIFGGLFFNINLCWYASIILFALFGIFIILHSSFIQHILNKNE